MEVEEQNSKVNVDSRILKPGFCCFGVTDACMLRCKMCEKWKGDLVADTSTNRPPTLEEWKRCAASLRRMVDEHFIIDIGGGEALMMEGVLDLVRYSVDLGFDTSIASNGWPINEDMAGKIANSGLKMISISLDSHRKEVHDYLRGVRGVYDRVINAIDYLHKYCSKDFSINICCAIYEINQGDIMELIKWASSNDKITGSINFMACMQPNNTPPEEEWYLNKYSFLWPRDPDRTIDIIENIINLKKNKWKIGNPISQLRAFQAYYQDPKKFVKKKQCNLDRAVHVSGVGDMFLCYQWECLGNIKTDNLKDRWYSDDAFKVREKIAECKNNCHFLLNCFDEFDEDFRG